MTVIYQNEMLKLIKYLIKNNIDFSLYSFSNGIQVVCDNWDVVCNDGSFGYRDSLLEAMGLPQFEEGEPVGNLTAKMIIELLEELRQ